MSVKDITTTITTNLHQVVASRFERAYYESDDQLQDDLKNDLTLQATNFEKTCDTLVVNVYFNDSEKVETLSYNAIDVEKVCEDVAKYFVTQ